MTGAAQDETAKSSSRLLTVWWQPRQTIRAIVAQAPRRWVLLLGALGGTASAIGWLSSVGIGQALADWRVLLPCIIGGGALGILNLYVNAWAAAGVGRLLGGAAPAQSLRAVFAWGMLPTIAAALVVVAVALAVRLSGSPDVLSGALVVAIGICGIWSMLMTVLMLGSVEGFGLVRSLVTYGTAALGLSALVALVIRTLLFQPFSIPSGSSIPTLLPGDYVFASKYAYGYSRYSLPFGIITAPGRVLESDPARGDLVVFRLPKDERTDYVKRVVGLPGDLIQMKAGELVINDRPVQRERSNGPVDLDACGPGAVQVKRWRETLPNGVSYDTLDCADNGYLDNTPAYTVPTGSLFVMGDNRDNSTDSRMMSAIGFVPIDHVFARVSMIFFSRAAGESGKPSTIRLDRVGMQVR